MRITVLDAPSNLGLRPPTPTSVPGCAKAPGALRDHGLLTRLGARDAGCVTPPRFDPGRWRPGDGVAQADQIARFSTRLADRVGAILAAGEFPLVLGGDCSVAVGTTLALRRLEAERGGRFGLVYIDAHSDFRHPGNAAVVGAAAGEALALVTGRGQAELAGIEARRPYVRDADVVLVGMRDTDDYRVELQAGAFNVRTAHDVRASGASRSAQWVRSLLTQCDGYWIHLDADVLDPSVMPAVDAPTPGGIAYPELEDLLQGLLVEGACLGMEVTVFDPDLDEDGVCAKELVTTLVTVLGTKPEPAPVPAQTRRTPRPRKAPAAVAAPLAPSATASTPAVAPPTGPPALGS